MIRKPTASWWAVRLAATLVLILTGLALYAYWEASWDPVVRRADVALAGWPKGEKPVTVLLVSDTHVAGPEMPPERLARIVDGLNALKPDLVVLTGDYVSDKKVATHRYSVGESVAPLGRLRSRLGIVGVLGNHDHWRGAPAFRDAFARHRIALLANEAIRRGPLVIGGVDDEPTGHSDLAATQGAMTALGAGPRILLSHSPDIMPSVRAGVTAVMAGHTHCGQIALPFIGPLVTMSRYGKRFACGHIVNAGTDLFVSAGVGTSILPLRFGAPPDVWLIRFGPKP
ncbi:MAG: metallophosphoesterase [Sphingobium sp.]|nr:metallophosphoesterase [Sphingobium sp.]